jgi:hypothetical protein
MVQIQIWKTLKYLIKLRNFEWFCRDQSKVCLNEPLHVYQTRSVDGLTSSLKQRASPLLLLMKTVGEFKNVYFKSRSSEL